MINSNAYNYIDVLSKAADYSWKRNEIIANNTGKPLDVIERDTERDNYMTAQEALEYGLIDEIVTNRK